MIQRYLDSYIEYPTNSVKTDDKKPPPSLSSLIEHNSQLLNDILNDNEGKSKNSAAIKAENFSSLLLNDNSKDPI